MSVKEEVMQLVEELSESDLLVAKRLLQDLALPQERHTPRHPSTAEERRRAKVREVFGKYAHTHTSVDAFLARKREDLELEEERYRRRHPEEA